MAGILEIQISQLRNTSQCAGIVMGTDTFKGYPFNSKEKYLQ